MQNTKIERTRQHNLVLKLTHYLFLVAPVLLVMAILVSVALAQDDTDPVNTAAHQVFLPLITDEQATKSLLVSSDVTTAIQFSLTFAELTTDLAAMNNFYGGGLDGNEPVTFDVKAAQEAGFREESILLAADLATFSNQIVQTQKEAAASEGNGVGVDEFGEITTAGYPRVEAFYQLATTSQATAPAVEAPNLLCSLSRHCTCGWYPWPRPSRSADRLTDEAENAENPLRARGYHPPPPHLGRLGWTRPQTYKWYMCGWSTFRDNAWPLSSKRFWEQNYSEWTPNGEPNPEVWRSGPWPYHTWPAYVFWWHQIY